MIDGVEPLPIAVLGATIYLPCGVHEKKLIYITM